MIWDNGCCVHSAIGGYPLHENRLRWSTTALEPGLM